MEVDHNETAVCIQAREENNKEETQAIIEFDKIEDILDFNDNSYALRERAADSKSPQNLPMKHKIIAKEPIKLLELKPIIHTIGKHQEDSKDEEADFKTKSTRKFLCSICEKRFVRSAHMHRHMRIHTGEKPYFCPICRQRFSRKDRMSAHLQSHRSEKVHRCCVCRETYSDMTRFVDHCRLHDDSEYMKVAKDKSIVQANLKRQVQVVEDSILVSTFNEQLGLASCVMIEKLNISTAEESTLHIENPIYVPA